MGCADAPASFSKCLPKLSQLTCQSLPVQTAGPSQTCSHHLQRPYGCRGPSSLLSPSKRQMVYPNKVSENKELWLPSRLGQISARGPRARSSWRHPGGCCTSPKVRGRSTPVPAAEERTQKLQNVGVMSRARGSSPGERAGMLGEGPHCKSSCENTSVSKPIPVKEKRLHLPVSISWHDEDPAALHFRRLTVLELGTSV